MFSTPSASPIWRRSWFWPLKAKEEVRPATFSSLTFARELRISSEMPSEKYSLPASSLMLTNGSTAMDFSRGPAASLFRLGGFRGLHQGGVALRGQRKLVVGEVTQRQDQDKDDGQVEFLPGLAGDGLAAVDVLFFLDTFRRQLECPGQKQRQWKTRDQHQQDRLDRPVGYTKRFQEYVRDLRNQPRQHDVCRADLEDIASFQLLKQPGHFLSL